MKTAHFSIFRLPILGIQNGEISSHWLHVQVFFSYYSLVYVDNKRNVFAHDGKVVQLIDWKATYSTVVVSLKSGCLSFFSEKKKLKKN